MPSNGLRRAKAKPLATFTPTNNAPARPGPCVTATASRSFQLAFAVSELLKQLMKVQILRPRRSAPMWMELGHGIDEVGGDATVDCGQGRIVCEVPKQPEGHLVLCDRLARRPCIRVALKLG